MSPVTILDFGAGNLTSVACALRHLGAEPRITRDPAELTHAERVIFPGVGAAGATMDHLRKLELGDALRQFVAAGRPLLGICIGCQVIFEASEEDGGTACLGLLAGRVKRFTFPREAALKVPHMGWNEVRFRGDHPVFRGIAEASQFYFVHSYYPLPRDPAVVLGEAEYGGLHFAAAFATRNLAAVQFHAEKSGPPGLQVIANFLRWNPD
jgi:glutamine amidotransferase